MIDYQVTDPLDVESAIVAAFDHFRSERAHSARLLLPAAMNPGRDLASMLLEELQKCPDLGELILVHTSPTVWFVASTLTLQHPNVRVNVEIGEGSSKGAQPALPGSQISNRDGTFAVRIESMNDVEKKIRSSFTMLRTLGANAVIVSFLSEHAFPRDATDPLTDELLKSEIHVLALVHPSPATRFVASTLRLRCPGIMVAASETLEEATAFTKANAA